MVCVPRRGLARSITEVVKVTHCVRPSGRSQDGSGEAAPEALAPVVRDGVAKAVGAYGERLAARYLLEAGMQVLDRNWRCDQGEVDIVAMDDRCLVVVEVKTRRSLAFGPPVEAVTPSRPPGCAASPGAGWPTTDPWSTPLSTSA